MHSAQKPKADVNFRAPETKKSSSNPVSCCTKLQSEPTKPAKFTYKMDLVVAQRTRLGCLVKVPARYSS